MNREQMLQQLWQLIDMGAQPVRIDQHWEAGQDLQEIEVTMHLTREARVRGPRRVEEAPASVGDIIDVECLGEEWDGDVPKELTNGW